MIQIYTNDYSAHFIIAEARCHAPIVLPQRRRSASGACFQAPGGGRFVVKKWWNTVGTGWKMVGNDETWSELLKHVETCWRVFDHFLRLNFPWFLRWTVRIDPPSPRSKSSAAEKVSESQDGALDIVGCHIFWGKKQQYKYKL